MIDFCTSLLVVCVSFMFALLLFLLLYFALLDFVEKKRNSRKEVEV